jgi:hypothetical protein
MANSRENGLADAPNEAAPAGCYVLSVIPSENRIML